MRRTLDISDAPTELAATSDVAPSALQEPTVLPEPRAEPEVVNNKNYGATATARPAPLAPNGTHDALQKLPGTKPRRIVATDDVEETAKSRATCVDPIPKQAKKSKNLPHSTQATPNPKAGGRQFRRRGVVVDEEQKAKSGSSRVLSHLGQSPCAPFHLLREQGSSFTGGAMQRVPCRGSQVLSECF